MKRISISIVTLLFTTFAITPAKSSFAQASEPFVGQLALVGFNFCPRGWLSADGQLLDISQNQALFSLFGTIYGGDGRTTFALPDLRGRAPIHMGQGTGLENYPIGQPGGAETVTLNQQQMPVHSHGVTDLANSNGTTPGLVVRNGNSISQAPTSDAGGGQAHENRSPYLTMLWCVATEGIYPSRN